MGSSVFHGGASTFLAVSVLGFSTSYTFEVFFKTWFGIVIFGMSNGFLLLPVILSLVGPLGSTAHAKQTFNKARKSPRPKKSQVMEQVAQVA